MSGVGAVSAVLARIGIIERRLGSMVAIPAASTVTTGIPAPSPPATTTATVGGLAEPATAGTGPAVSFDALLQAIERGSETPRASYASSAGFGASAGGAGGGVTPIDLSEPVALDAGGRVAPSVPYSAVFDAAGARWGISPRLLAAVAKVESGYRADAVSSAGAVGVMQLMPETAQGLGVDPHDPVASIDAGARLLRDLRDRFGSIEVALGAYNVGPGTISRAGGIVPGSQAERYVDAVLAALETIP